MVLFSVFFAPEDVLPTENVNTNMKTMINFFLLTYYHAMSFVLEGDVAMEFLVHTFCLRSWQKFVS
jgi:hypothetical protein